MNRFRIFTFAAVVSIVLAAAPTKSQAQVGIGINIGTAPVCPYGYYDYEPYACAPYGYYGPEWFNDGVFIGVGPWFHGRDDFRGHVNNHYDVHRGYHGRLPDRGEQASRKERAPRNFRGNEARDGRGHSVDERH